VNAVSPDWFATYGIPRLAGRDISTRDIATSPMVIVVNETFAKKFFPGTSALGKTVREVPRPGMDSPALEIVGIVKDAVYLSPREGVLPTMYRARMQQKGIGPGVDIAVRATSGSPAMLTRSLVDAIMRVDPDLTLTIHPLARDIRAATVQERVVAMLSGFFGALALILAGLGLYGVMSYAVSRRRTEIGIRMALGAQPAAAIGLVVRRAAVLIVTGIGIGAALSVWASQFVSSLLYGLPPRDPATLVGAGVVLTIVGALAGWLPARRASRIDPARVLREG